MATYSFETITAAQALAFTATDLLSFHSGTATQASAAYLASGDVAVTVGSLTVEFGPGLIAASQLGLFAFPDGTRLYVGDGSANVENLQQDTHQAALFGGDGNDTFTLGSAGGLEQGNQGNDNLTSTGQATIYGGQGDDVIMLGDSGGFGQGNKGDDSLVGGHGSETLLGGQGDDTIASTSSGFDADGANFLNGNLGNDSIHAGNGPDQIFGEGGNDTINAGQGNNFVDGGDGADSITGGAVASTLQGGAGDDWIVGTGVIDGGDGDDTLVGNAGDNNFLAATVSGGAGNDEVGGSNGDDVLSGGDGNDIIIGGSGFDTESGGAGSDLFFFSSVDARIVVGGKHVAITDWTSSDQLTFGQSDSPRDTIAGTASNYVEVSAFDQAAAIDAATTQFRAGKLYVAVQVGSDVIVFANTLGTPTAPASDGVFLVGKSLADIDFSNIVQHTI